MVSSSLLVTRSCLLFSVIPATSSSTGETTPPQGEDSDSVPGGDDTEDTAPRRKHAEDRQDVVSRCDIAPLPVEVLERNRLSAAEIRAVPRFTNYAQGEPSKVRFQKYLL